MAYIIYNLNKAEAKQYKGFYYQKSNDKYIIFNSRGDKVGLKFTVKSCKEFINNL